MFDLASAISKFVKMEKRPRLGRGLNSLMSTSGEIEPIHRSLPDPPAPSTPAPPSPDSSPDPAGPRLRWVELDRIVPNPYQPRREFDEFKLRTLADSIRVAGLIQPILVCEAEDHFQIVAGERRWRAARLAGQVSIPCLIRVMDAPQQSQFALIENIHRQSLNPIERAQGYHGLLVMLGLTHQELADKLGEDRSTIANHLRLLDLHSEVIKMIAAGLISFGHAKLIASIEDPEKQLQIAQLVVELQLSVRSLEQRFKEEPKPAAAPQPSPRPLSPHIADLERQISRDLQMRTEVHQSKRGQKGRIVIHYASLDQFDQLIQRLNVKIED